MCTPWLIFFNHIILFTWVPKTGKIVSSNLFPWVRDSYLSSSWLYPLECPTDKSAKNWEISKIVSDWQAKKLACHSLMDLGRRHETLGWETNNLLLMAEQEAGLQVVPTLSTSLSLPWRKYCIHVWCEWSESESHSVLVLLFVTPWTSPWKSPGQNSGVSSSSLLQGIFPTQRSNPDLPNCRQILYQLSHQGSPAVSMFGGHVCLKRQLRTKVFIGKAQT